jgi:acetolactate synthase-1/2/3 large subunit
MTVNGPSAAQRLLQTAAELGVEYIFTNLGSDHPAFIEAFSRIEEVGGLMPKIVICPHEMTALSAAHGHAMSSRRAQMVLVHVDVGTQNLGCSIHNAARSRVPAIIVAGLSPTTTSGDRIGARTEYIHYTQDTSRQHEIVGQYMKWSYELRAAEMVDVVVRRGLQIAACEPQGPVYLTGAREVWEVPVEAPAATAAAWSATSMGSLSPSHLRLLHEAFSTSKRPLVITSYCGRHPESARRLVALSEHIGFAVCEVSPNYMNFPGDHPNHVGYRRNALVGEADLILLLDVDVPWIVSKVQPALGARVLHIDLDPVKSNMGFWHFPAELCWLVDSVIVLEQWLDLAKLSPSYGVEERRSWIAASRQNSVLPSLPERNDGSIDVQHLSDAIRAVIDDNSILVLEAPTLTERLLSTLRMKQPGSFFANGGSGLGWGINAAIGLKLARPKADVITVTGDGSYVFGVPSSAFWVSQAYDAPTLTIINNNSGWNAPKQSTLLVHPDGDAVRRDRFWVTLGRGARYAEIAAAAGGAAAFKVDQLVNLEPSLREALTIVRGGRSAVLDVVTIPISGQVLS